ncbi:DNA-binding protein [Streptomyces sp. NPDC127044]
MTTQPTLAEVRSWPATVSVQQAARALGCGKSKLYALIARGEAPVRTLSFDKRVVVITASLVQVLGGDTAPTTASELLSA